MCKFTDIGTHRARSMGARSGRAAGGVRRCLMTPMRAPPLPRTMAQVLGNTLTRISAARISEGRGFESEPLSHRSVGQGGASRTAATEVPAIS